MGTHQGDPLGKALFVLARSKALSFIVSRFPSYLFPSIVDDIHITCLYLIISFVYEHFQTFHAIGDATPNFLKYSNVNLKMKTLKEKGIRTCSLARSTYGVKRAC